MILVGPLEKMRKTLLLFSFLFLFFFFFFFFFLSRVASNDNFMKKNKKKPAHILFNMEQEGIEEIGLGSQTKQKESAHFEIGKIQLKY